MSFIPLKVSVTGNYNRMMRTAVRFVLRGVALRLLRVRATYSAETVATLRHERVIVCSNHVSLLDGVIVALASPVPLTFGVDTDFSRHSKVASRGMATLAWLGFGSVVPIDGSSPFGIRSLSKALDRGESVMLFPEGKISETGCPNPDQPGVVWLAQRSGAEVVRIRIRGAERSRLFAKSGDQLWPRIEIQF
ncbi:1-acyl-sn-glycerol-3-phosphate acyltransferase [Ralstonia mannitolilytica]|uniref:1-acyl-sn-glycerol-3-phosphate acyltransferase n=1 Tax=Ralstonia mannitolilytica TaxID=105219 RepID=UPI0037481799